MYLFILGRNKAFVFYDWMELRAVKPLTEVSLSVGLYFLQLSWDCWVSWTSCLLIMPVTASSPAEPQSSWFLDLRFVKLQLKINLSFVLLISKRLKHTIFGHFQTRSFDRLIPDFTESRFFSLVILKEKFVSMHTKPYNKDIYNHMQCSTLL